MGGHLNGKSRFHLGASLLLVVLLILFGGGSGGEEEETEDIVQKEEKQVMKLASEAFKSGDQIPAKYTCTGEDISPPLSVKNVDPDAETLVIVVDDPDAPAGVFDHWLIWNIPADTSLIPAAIPQKEKVKALDGAVQGTNGFGELGYRGPCPPGGSEHTYRFNLYALDQKLGLKPRTKKEKLLEAMEDHILDRALLTGVYSR